jgi:hypothetical protein
MSVTHSIYPNLLLRGVRTMKTNLAGTMVYQKADLWHPAFRPSGVMNSDVSEVTETDEDVLIINARDAPRLVPDDALERPAAAADGQVITEYVDSEKWCGEERTKYAVVKVEAISFVLAVICVALALVLVSVMFPDEWALIGA